MNKKRFVARLTIISVLSLVILASVALFANMTIAKESTPDGLIFDEDPEPSLPLVKLNVTTALSSLTGAVTWMKEEVPWYEQRKSNWCWAASLTMQHQWWCPVQLGTGTSQQTDVVVYIKGSDVNTGATVDEIHTMMKEWGTMNSDYESYQFTWAGEGKLFSTDAPTGSVNDPKTWLAYVESPVICGVDTGTDGYANHAVVVIGYDDSLYGGAGGVYVHDPWYLNWWPGHSGESCYEITLSYSEFNAKWNSYYATDKKRGMIAGVPGDNKFTEINYYDTVFDGTIYDDETNYARNIGIGVTGDDSSPAYDSFGQYYREGVCIRLTDPASGETATPYSKGTFSFVSPIPPGHTHIEFVTHAIPKDGKRTGGYFHIKPKVVGWIQVEVTWQVYDEDDRFHTSVHITVLDDRDGLDTSHSMYKPELYERTYDPWTPSFRVDDDDTTGPKLSNAHSEYLLASGIYRLFITATDTSGISTVEFRYKFGTGSWSPWYTYSSWSVNTFWYDTGKPVWGPHTGETLYWQSRAYDNDNDRPNDQAYRTTSTYTMYYLTVDTDPAGLDSPTGEGWYDKGEVANVSVSLVTGYTFEYWYLNGASGTPYSHDMTTTVTMDNNHRITAKFSPIPCKLTFYTDPAEKGFNITFKGATYTNGQSATFDYSTSNSTTASAPTGWIFDHWESTANISVPDPYDNPTDIIIRCGGSLKAIFKPQSNVVITSFYVSPGPFSPNGDGKKDTTIISAKFTNQPDVQPIQTTSVEWTLRVKTVYTDTRRTWLGMDSTVNVRWDGTDEAGYLLPDGEYSILLQGRDKDGNLTEIEKRLVVIDTENPEIKGGGASPDPFNPKKGETTTISYELSERCHVMIEIYDPTGKLIAILRALQLAGKNSMTWDGRVQGLVVPDGTYRYEIHASDMAGNEAETGRGEVTVKT